VRRGFARRRTAWYNSSTVAAFTLEFSMCIALHCGDATHRAALCRAGSGVKEPLLISFECVTHRQQRYSKRRMQDISKILQVTFVVLY